MALGWCRIRRRYLCQSSRDSAYVRLNKQFRQLARWWQQTWHQDCDNLLPRLVFVPSLLQASGISSCPKICRQPAGSQGSVANWNDMSPGISQKCNDRPGPCPPQAAKPPLAESPADGCPGARASIGVSKRRAAIRLFDVVVSAILIVLSLPLCAILALLVALATKAQPVQWRRRVNGDGNAFKLYRFRTKRRACNNQGVRLTDSQRSSSIGRLMSRSGLENLPKLFNVLTGDISFF